MADDEISVRVRMKERLKFSRDAKKTKEEVEDIGKGADHSEKGMKKFNTQMRGFSNIIALIRPAALIVALGLLAQGASAATAGVVGLVAGLAPLVGIFAVMPGMAIAAAQGMVLAKLALSGVGEALGGLHDKIDEDKFKLLTHEGRLLVLELDKLKKPIIEIQRRVQRGMFPGLVIGIRRASTLLEPFADIAERTGWALGQIAKRTGTLLASWRGDFRHVGRDSVTMIRQYGNVGLNLAAALEDVVMAARPLSKWLNRTAVGWSWNVRAAAQAGREHGKLQGFFRKTQRALQLTMGVLKPFSKALGNILGLGTDTGFQILEALGDSAESFEQWTRNAKGQKAITQWFTNSLPAVMMIGSIISYITKEFLKLGQGESFLNLLTQIRDQLLPAIFTLIKDTTEQFGPILIDALSNVALLLTDMAGSSAPLGKFVSMLGDLAGWLHMMALEHPEIHKLVVNLLGLYSVFAVMEAMGIVGLALKIAGGLRSIAAGQWAWNVAQYANPIGLTIAAVVALAAMFAFLYFHQEQVGQWFQRMWEKHPKFFGWVNGQITIVIDTIDRLLGMLDDVFNKWDRLDKLMFGDKLMPNGLAGWDWESLGNFGVSNGTITIGNPQGRDSRGGGGGGGAMPRMSQMSMPAVPSMDAIEPISANDLSASKLFATLVMPDGRVLAEVVADEVKHDEARR